MAPGQAIMAVPPTDFGAMDAMWWQFKTGQRFIITGGYFIAPVGNVDGAPATVEFTSPVRPTTQLLRDVAGGKPIPPITAAIRQQTSDDFRYWRVALVVLLPADAGGYQPVLEAILGPGRLQGGVLIWDTRALLG
jgi:hypothetical protein